MSGSLHCRCSPMGRIGVVLDIALGVFLGGLLLKIVWWFLLDWALPW